MKLKIADWHLTLVRSSSVVNISGASAITSTSTGFIPKIWHHLTTWLVFRKTDLYLIITQKLTFHEIRRISYGFYEIWRISWNPADFTQISPVKSTQNYKSKCFSKNSSVWWMQGGGFHLEIWWISPVKSGGFHPDFTCEIHPKL